MCLSILQVCAVKNKIKEEIERYSIIRAVTAVERADVVIIVIDAIEGLRNRMQRSLALHMTGERNYYRCQQVGCY